MTKTKNDFSFRTAEQLVDRIIECDYFVGDDPAIPVIWRPSKISTKLVLVTGENASGKSFFRRLATEITRRNEIESIHVSMEGRRSVAYNPMLTFVYGDESYEATGINSIRTVLSGIRTCEGRDKPHVIIWDEPDIGLSEGNAGSVGKTLSDFARNAPKHTKAIVVITHRRALAVQLVPASPHYLFLGDATGPSDLGAWLAAPPVIRPLQEVEDGARARFKAIQKVLNKAKERK